MMLSSVSTAGSNVPSFATVSMSAPCDHAPPAPAPPISISLSTFTRLEKSGPDERATNMAEVSTGSAMPFSSRKQMLSMYIASGVLPVFVA